MTDIKAAQLAQSIALVGMMGVGKTTIGRRLAKRLNMPFYDSDSEIERASGRTIKGYFRDHGQDAFREGERKVISRLIEGTPIILATGGGAFIPELTRNILLSGATVIWLKADHKVIFKRVRRKNTRPLLDVPNPSQRLAELIEERYPIYAQAHITVDSNVGPHRATVERVLAALREGNILTGEQI
ncbi:shikimate kinase [Robiginitomaculum antarcticum]|uniref:shikimate kinase n=1 Tax=Robiginitomaculum antarcticum TaxID=437507 RepID=UPI00035C4E49|nr:shikimate kinase [Robiginitomaculum antarcticum]